MAQMEIVSPRHEESYQIVVDKNRLAVSSGLDKDAPKVWLSRGMVEWLNIHGVNLIEEESKNDC